MEEIDGTLRWSPKIPGFKVRQLYMTHARGRLDEELLDDVAWTLWQRSRDIVIVTDALRGRATCPRCGATLVHDGRPRSVLACPGGFQLQWRAYKRSFRDRELWGGNATGAFHAFVKDLPNARTISERVILVDRVIHAAHVSIREGLLTRRAVSNLIEGPASDVMRLLEELAYGPGAEPELRQTREDWLAMSHRAGRRALAARTQVPGAAPSRLGVPDTRRSNGADANLARPDPSA